MKTRIISGAALIALTVAILISGAHYPIILTVFLALLSSMACYEILNNTGIVKNKAAVYAAMGYALLSVFARFGVTKYVWNGFSEHFFAILLVLVVVVISLKNHKEFSLAQISATIGMPIILSFAFTSLSGLYLRENGLFYLLLLLNFSSCCDCGAYFTGVAIGKHKLCPNISPKKTIEGAVGGVITSIIVSVILCFAFNKTQSLLQIGLSTIIFCIIGMCGDLFASVIKRSAGIKDYGKLIPGHGGILDRFDSILLIAPVLLFCIERGLF